MKQIKQKQKILLLCTIIFAPSLCIASSWRPCSLSDYPTQSRKKSVHPPRTFITDPTDPEETIILAQLRDLMDQPQLLGTDQDRADYKSKALRSIRLNQALAEWCLLDITTQKLELASTADEVDAVLKDPHGRITTERFVFHTARVNICSIVDKQQTNQLEKAHRYLRQMREAIPDHPAILEAQERVKKIKLLAITEIERIIADKDRTQARKALEIWQSLYKHYPYETTTLLLENEILKIQ